ncbi:hypothetical protein CJU94_36710 (plasmid) [Paraburkholderia aromaticivorans]|uniref:Uncharacterized protein n=1 Tax=Paraburkholderia aromaticivorans TaxID=2026199 RepID=A0A248VXN9_9BURK|nr:hypothetical protein CJU94_36710 [Paraburkholderia aromaticivorans]
MCYGEPDKLLELVLGNRELPRNDLGHTPLDDFRDFCARTRCKEDHGLFFREGRVRNCRSWPRQLPTRR